MLLSPKAVCFEKISLMNVLCEYQIGGDVRVTGFWEIFWESVEGPEKLPVMPEQLFH